MERMDLELIENVSRRDAILAALWKEHQTLEQQLSKLERKPFLTTQEQVERNRIKKLKLAGRDKIEAILSRYRDAVRIGSHAS
ncbi:MAG: YdcH family protein [Deltaproteobacteria bacterium]|nr:YdcH family protein [Deltaproteobacteria bacterium]